MALQAIVEAQIPATSGQLTLRARSALLQSKTENRMPFRVRDRACRISHSHHLRDQGDMGRDLRRRFPARPGSSRWPTALRPSPARASRCPPRTDKIAQVAVRPGGRGRQIPRSVQARRAAGPAAAGRLSLCQRAARHAPRHACLRARQLSLRPLPQGGCARRQAGAARRRRRRRHHANGGGGARLPATSSIRRRTTWGRRSWRWPRATSRPALRRAVSTASSATI